MNINDPKAFGPITEHIGGLKIVPSYTMIEPVQFRFPRSKKSESVKNGAGTLEIGATNLLIKFTLI